MDRLIRHFDRNAPIENIDRTANGLATKEQGGRPAENLDAVSCDWIDRDSMVSRGVRRINCTNAIRQNANAFTLETAQDRAGCAGRKGCRRNAGQRRQRIANLRTNALVEFLSGKCRGTGDQVQLFNKACGHNNTGTGIAMEIVARSLFIIVLRDGGDGEKCGAGRQYGLGREGVCVFHAAELNGM